MVLASAIASYYRIYMYMYTYDIETIHLCKQHYCLGVVGSKPVTF